MKLIRKTPIKRSPAAPIAILLVEDNSMDAELLEAALCAESLQFNLTRVDTRGAFVNALETQPFDIILSDHSLPSFDGKSALDIAHAKYPEIPFIFVSGTIGEELAVETLKRGATDYVLKNRLSRLVPAMQRALAESEERGKRRRAENALLESEERHRPLFELNPMPMWVYDLKTLRFLAVNEAAIRRYGYSRQEFLSMTIEELRTREDISEFLSDAMKRKSEDVPRTWKHRTRNGSIILVEVWPHTLTFGGREARLILANDLTEQKMLEDEQERLLEKLETERALFQAVLSQMPGGVTIAEAPSGKIILDNEQSRRILGHDQSSDSKAGDFAKSHAFHLDGLPYQPQEWPL